jgi:C1A family cysteine protease
MASLLSTLVMVALLALCAARSMSVENDFVRASDDTFDWRTKGVISPVSNEGQLGVVFAIVIAEGVESLHAIQSGAPVSVFSRKEVADCCLDQAHQPKYHGFDCIPKISGLCLDSTYKSEGGRCNNGSCTPVGKVTRTGYVPTNQETVMATTIHQTPLIAYMDSSKASFQEYISGIYSDPTCSQTELDHAVQIVGYGTEAGQDYWILKNSWGPTWGEKGYMRIVRGKNMCGIATYVFYPINQQ